MSHIAKFTFNPFAENTFVVSDDTKQCVIIDPGCSNEAEENQLEDYINQNNLTPVKLLNTHCHLDHIAGNQFVAEKWNLKLEANQEELPILNAAPQVGAHYGFIIPASPDIETFLNDGDVVQFGNTSFKVLFTPGHSPGSISFYNAAEQYIISGDVLFQGGVGRWDLPLADGAVLKQTLENVMLKLDDDVKVYCGHGDETTIGTERATNPFLI